MVYIPSPSRAIPADHTGCTGRYIYIPVQPPRTHPLLLPTIQVTRSKKAKWLEAAVDALGNAKQPAYTRQQLTKYLDSSVPLELRRYRPPARTLTGLLDKTGVLHTVNLFPEGHKPHSNDRAAFIRYTRDSAAQFAIALSLRSGSYLSHSTAGFVHNLAPTSNTIYVNKEQGPKRSATAGLSQVGIDRAFANSPRRTTYVFTDGTHTYVLLNGKHTGNAGVEFMEDRQGPLRVTTLARTVVDLVVRPQYAGGSQGVLNVIRKAIGRVSVEKLAATLNTLDHIYPYHQALGFYLDKAGYPESQVAQLLGFDMSYDFYLEHRSPVTAFDAKWRIHYPAQLR